MRRTIINFFRYKRPRYLSSTPRTSISSISEDLETSSADPEHAAGTLYYVPKSRGK